MGRKKTHTVTEVTQRPSLFRTDIPFDITLKGQVIATVVKPTGAVWRVCENCGESTLNIIEFQDKNLQWQKLILCDKCADEYL